MVVVSLAAQNIHCVCVCVFLPRVAAACLPQPSKEHPFIAFPVEAQANCSVLFPVQRLPLKASIIVKNVQQNASKDDILRPLFPAQL